ncbi:sugar O-acetyltransferase [Laedolimicola intestinihominis]|uniref:Acetyltransferase n=1 Tax=Laedolimicola intestinihominis TaxID=3133166 RepID=A0ABV1FG73_9FIRM
MTEWEKAEAGLLYDAKYDPDLDRGRKASQELSFDYNALRPSQIKEREEMVRKHFKKTGKKFLIEQPFRCDFWERVSVGENFYSNYNFVVLAGNTIDIGDNVMFAPDCGLYAAGHPFDVELRNSGIEYAWPIRIGNNVWIGGGTKIIGGVSIGDDVIIAAGSVVIRDIPSGVLAGGNPCKVIRKLTPEDDEKYKKGFQGFSEG